MDATRKRWRQLQELSRERAHRHGEEWTSEEMVALEDTTKSSIELALILGRTITAVHSRRAEVGIRVRPTPDSSEWLIDLTPQNAAEREVFRELGAVPESEWEWNEESA